MRNALRNIEALSDSHRGLSEDLQMQAPRGERGLSLKAAVTLWAGERRHGAGQPGEQSRAGRASNQNSAFGSALDFKGERRDGSWPGLDSGRSASPTYPDSQSPHMQQFGQHALPSLQLSPEHITVHPGAVFQGDSRLSQELRMHLGSR